MKFYLGLTALQEAHLQTILESMDIPPKRKNDTGWLLRNLGIRNSTHVLYDYCIDLLKAKNAHENDLQKQGRK